MPVHKYISFYLSLIILIPACSKQPKTEEPNPIGRKSPIAIAKMLHPYTETYIKVVYGQPYKKGSQIIGKLVPYNKVWRTGANEATELTTTRDILLNDQKLKAGTYELFSIPKDDEPWTIIFNNELGQWGAFNYRQVFDELRLEAESYSLDKPVEAFTIQFAPIEDHSSAIILQWGNTEVRIPITFLESDHSSQ